MKMCPFEACKAIKGRAGGMLPAGDYYYVGVVFIAPDDDPLADAYAYITDGDGKKLDFIDLVRARHGDTRTHNVPVPVLASGGLNIYPSDSDASWVLYYAEQVGGHKHV